REGARTAERDAQGRDSQDQRVLITAVVREKPFLGVGAHTRDHHHGQRDRRGERRQQAKRQQQPGSRFSQSREQRVPPAGNEAQLLEEPSRARQSVPAEPAEQLLRPMGGQGQADHEAQHHNSDTHAVVPRSFLMEWYYLRERKITTSLPDVKGLSFGKHNG